MSRLSESPKALKATWMAANVTGRFSKRISGFFASQFWFTPWATDTGPKAEKRHAKWLAGTQEVAVPYRDGYLKGFAAGRGPVVLLVHGWGERAATLGALVRPLVDAGYRVIGIDLPAHGSSPGRTTNILEEADALRTIVDELDSVHGVIAHSMGGAITAHALEQGMPIDRVAFVAPAVRLDSAMEVFAEVSGLPPLAIEGLQEDIERRFGASVWEDFAADRAAADMRVPALVVHDVDDVQVPYADGERLAAAWPGAKLVTTEGLGHMRILGDARVHRALLDHLAGVEADAVSA